MASMTPPAMSPPMMPESMRRPTGVTILAVLDFLGAALLLLVGLLFMAGGGMLSTMMGGEDGGLLAMLGAALGVVMLIFAVVLAVLGWGFWKGMSWAWWIALVLWGLSALSAVASIVQGDFISGIISLAIDVFLVWYITQRGVQRWFKISMSFPWAK